MNFTFIFGSNHMILKSSLYLNHMIFQRPTFNRWEEIFIDPTLTAAMVDRLAHKATIINIKGNSYRIKETKKWLNN